ncbi:MULTISPECIES: hypothetical protein [Flavobacteriaceae]|uniref:hypothetical protein n=1 Tax=Flavobacteriaceae TaxID=49546 RepID=UPI0010AE6B11|nr:MULTISPECIES: hypothetical protein [Flavobacteriaceae]NJB35014.1 hypothetical protein [Croceivirga sp. JEA036]TKD63449.1 hypothetical protein FBT53_08880 [Flavobacterium sp. ASW18X]
MNKKTLNGRAFGRKLMLASTLSAGIIASSCGGNGEPKLKDFKEETIYEATKGTITEVEEVEPGDEYKIIDERLIDKKENSIAIVHTLEGKVDTLSLAKIENNESEQRYGRGLRSVLYYSLAASYFNRRLGNVAPNSSYYKDATAYNKSTGLQNELKSTATSRKVKVPGSSSKGYGSGKSFRSFGG